MTTQLETPRVYIASLTDYNEGRLVGKWFDLSDYSDADEVLTAIAEYFADLDKEQPLNGSDVREEWAAHDYENFPESLYSESLDFQEVLDYWELVSDMDEERAEAFELFCNNSGSEMNRETLSDFEEAYQGYYDGFNPQLDFTYQLVDELYDLEKTMGNLASYFDYEAFSRDLFMSDYWESKGHIFRNI